ncbi:inhibitory synaptic factor 1 [Puntigrus tetrazona]|uniref:inhibitory synaptic factor 1 n=1 Tax=Puntigrus tetrazona TaxID=1606681 RepID=UPI001C8AB6DC|nr:inhibitory synaptic factor 1 [Puntigrus tetrazona]XP_043119854.1 inhibitory synaptic factor 1 [Puntigrus tetrazona]XP_043119855.1 inhibitory synaptic factor 1 [Puntigrus tetrazona]
MSQSGAPAREPSETPSQREQIRSHMKMVIEQLEGILKELKDVAHELREVVGQIDKLTSDFDFDLEPDDWTVATASSTSSSERGLGEAFRLDFLSQDMLSDGWDFCSFLEASNRKAQREETDEGQGRPASSTASVYSQMNGGLPVPNGPLIVTPDSSSEEASSSTHSQKTRERVRFSDKILYHALCCDDDEDEEEDGGPEEDDKGDCGTPDTDSEPSPGACSPAEHPLGVFNCRETASAGPSPVKMPAMGSHTLPRKGLLNPKKLLRNSSTQTVSDKSTQTVLPYVPAKQKNKDL